MKKSRKRALKRLITLVIAIAFFVTAIPVGTADAYAGKNFGFRIAGENRYSTSIASADVLSNLLDEKFENVIVATGQNFPDALSGGCLCDRMVAPMILVNKSNQNDVVKYIKENMKSTGKVYILGGTSAVPGSFDQSLKKNGLSYERLEGKGRYNTNLKILQKIFKSNDILLVAKGKTFPDSLSASSVPYPMLLVDDKLSQDQINWLKKQNIKKIFVIGGESAVSKDIANKLKSYAPVERVSGSNRWETSYAVAKKFFSNADAITIATGKNFADALSGAPIALALGAPILLVAEGNWGHANRFVKEKKIVDSVVIGGPAAVKYSTHDKIMFGQRSYKTLANLNAINKSSSLNSRIDEQLDTLAGLLLERAPEGTPRLKDQTPWDKMSNVGQFVGSNYSYGNSTTAEGMLKTGSGTCFAYSELVYDMLKKLGLNCWLTKPGRHLAHSYQGRYNVYGSQHRSVVVLVNGQYYDVDGNAAFNFITGGLSWEPEKITKQYADWLLGKTNKMPTKLN